MSEIPAALTDAQIRELPGDPVLLKNVIADREARLAKARDLFKKQRDELAELPSLRLFYEQVEAQAVRIEKLVSDGYTDDGPEKDLKITRIVRGLVEELQQERSRRAAFESMLDRTRLIWTANTGLGGPPHESESWKQMLAEICKEANREGRGAAGDVPPF